MRVFILFLFVCAFLGLWGARPGRSIPTWLLAVLVIGTAGLVYTFRFV